MSYDASLLDLQNQIQDQINTLLIDPSPAVRRALVLNITPLCIFLGRGRTADVFGLLTTHLNDKDWLLRAAFFESTVGISTCIGSKSVDEYILPLMAEALADNEESVIARELGALSTLAQLGLYQRARLWETLAIVIPLLCHPNLWIRSSAASFVASAAKALPQTDAWCSLYPALRRMLRADIKDIDELGILEASVGPLSRDVYEAAILWAGRSAKSPFWQKSRQKGVDADAPLGKLLNDGTKLPLLSEEWVRPPPWFCVALAEPHSQCDRDKLEMQKLHMLGMTERDSFKLLAMRDYISSVAVARRK
jgi:phosphoinositide-3-kinase regulatory subunit 4